MFRRSIAVATPVEDEEHVEKKHRAYELSIAGRYDGIFALADDQRPGDGDVSILRVRLPPQFDMAGPLTMTVDDYGGGQLQRVNDGGPGINNLGLKTPTKVNINWGNVMNLRTNMWGYNLLHHEEDAPIWIMNGRLNHHEGWYGDVPNDGSDITTEPILDIELRTGMRLKEIYFWPMMNEEANFPKKIVLESRTGWQNNYTWNGAAVDVESGSTHVVTLTAVQPDWTAQNDPKVTSTGAHRYVVKDESLDVGGYLRIRISELFGTNFFFAIGEIMLVSEMPSTGEAQTRLAQPFFEGTPHQAGSLLHIHSQSFYAHNGTKYVGVGHKGQATVDAPAFDSFSARRQLSNLVLDAFTNRQSAQDEVSDISATQYVVTGFPSFVFTVTVSSDVLQIFVGYSPPNSTEEKRLLYAMSDATPGTYFIDHHNAFFPLGPGAYKMSSGVPATLTVIDHHALPTLTFSSNGSSAYGVCSLQVDNFFGTVAINDLLRHRLGLPLKNGFVDFVNGLASGVTRLNDVKRISLYLEPSVQFHVSSHLGESGDSIAENTLTVISFTVSGDDLDDTSLYSISSDFDVNAARMTSNKSAQIQFKVFKDVYDPIAKEYVSKPILLKDTEFAEIKMVVSQMEAES